MKIYFVAAVVGQSISSWFSLGRMRKVRQVIAALSDLGYEIELLNIAPFKANLRSPTGILYGVKRLCSTSFAPVRFIQILLSSVSFFLPLRLDTCHSAIWLYNSRLAEAIVALVALHLHPELRLVLQLEDLPSARHENSGLVGILDRISTILLSRRANHVFAVSKQVANAFSSSIDSCDSKITILPPALDPLFLQLAENRNQPFSSSRCTILYAGSFTEEKGVSDLIEAFLSITSVNQQLVLAGSAPQHLVDAFANLEQIHFAGIISDESLFELYTSADVVVNPHRLILNSNFVFPFKLIETVASGGLPLTTPMPGVEDFALPDDCIFLDTNELKDKLAHASQLWTKNKLSIQRASGRCRHRYSSEAIKNQILTALSKI
jgi:glycosyltransferase involved in cell wall biosynthesis